ncbi:arf-GAP with coiled-coil, ANK repeat and PH domain-containing protein 2 [Octopus bimaculoides]|uniref:arf-GAP with coiled-coil, ANK repeat and PH domain-containing protein 2 n=1 Tax=Octopus bimaculoides TaxID=37653 RepID=UPI0022E2C80C|nr:arf-GAP with coiled-coil, ANK repeat and PH domain-containing protein 2 [Octopus bimaculoides]
MRPVIEFRECLKDSPYFRASLEDAENDIELLEVRLEKLVKLCSSMIETGKAFHTASNGFVGGVRDLGQYFKDDDLASEDAKVAKSLTRFADAMTEVMKYFSMLMDQANRSVCKNINNFIKQDIRKVKEAKKYFEKISDEMDNALIKNSNALRSKPQECEDATNGLIAMSSAFAHNSLDYVYQINVLRLKKRFDVLETMLSFMNAQNTYFHQGHDLFIDLDPYVKNVRDQVEELSRKATVEKKEMEERHDLVREQTFKITKKMQSVKVTKKRWMRKRASKDFGKVADKRLSMDTIYALNDEFNDATTFFKQDTRYNGRKSSLSALVLLFCTKNQSFPTENLELASSAPFQADDSDKKMEGYLFKRTTNAFKSWVRRWFAIQDNQLVYRKRSKDSQTIMEEDLRLCTVKPVYEIDRRFCFEVVSPARFVHLSPQKNENYGTSGGGSNVPNNDGGNSNSNSPSTQNSKQQSKSQLRMNQLLSIPGNDRCCDCNSPDPRWASINLGITLCIECSGIHRSFGVHMSKVRSIMLDAWEPELLKVMAELGNDVVNRTYESNVGETVAAHATPDCTRGIREAWIRSKYIQKAFVSKLPGFKDNSSEKIQSWSVRKRTKRSPGRSLIKDDNLSTSQPSEKLENSSDLMKAVLSVSTATSKDNGNGHRNSEVLVFGTDVELPEVNSSKFLDLDLDSSEDSSTETEDTEDAKSTTSWEDMSKLDPNMLLYKAAQARNLPVMVEALAHGGNSNWINEEDEGKTPLMKSVETGSLAACEFLLLNGAKLDRRDQKGRTPLHHATIHGYTGQVCQFLKRGADRHAKDNEGKDAETIAIEATNADIVTLLRLARLNEEMSTDGMCDEMYNDVFRDFSNMASHNPEKLKRK